MAEIISEHYTQHVFFSQILEQRCHIVAPITMVGKFKILDDGSNVSASYAIKCPDASLRASWVIPTTRQNGSPMTLDQIGHYVMTIKLNDPSATSVTISGGDASCVSIATVDIDGAVGATSPLICAE